jgi:hypothetical protein
MTVARMTGAGMIVAGIHDPDDSGVAGAEPSGKP